MINSSGKKHTKLCWAAFSKAAFFLLSLKNKKQGACRRNRPPEIFGMNEKNSIDYINKYQV